jgi:hypothetical protein
VWCEQPSNARAGAPNERVLSATDMALLDMGAECVIFLPFSHLTEEIFSWCGRYFCYCSDITCSYPVSRTFSSDQRLVYETVLEAQKQILGEEALFIPAIMQFAHRAIGCVENFCSSHFNSCNEAWSVLAGHAPPHVARSADGEFLVYALYLPTTFTYRIFLIIFLLRIVSSCSRASRCMTRA